MEDFSLLFYFILQVGWHPNSADVFEELNIFSNFVPSQQLKITDDQALLLERPPLDRYRCSLQSNISPHHQWCWFVVWLIIYSQIYICAGVQQTKNICSNFWWTFFKGMGLFYATAAGICLHIWGSLGQSCSETSSVVGLLPAQTLLETVVNNSFHT